MSRSFQDSEVFEIVKTTTGAVSIRNNVVQEIMHNPVGPWQEANDLYIKQSGLAQKLQQNDPTPLVLYDVGLGAASNTLAAIHAKLNLSRDTSRKLHIISFECDLNLLRFALKHSHEFAHMTGFEGAMRTLLEKHSWKSPCEQIIWELREGDFLRRIGEETTKAEIVFYDPYSPAVNQEMWTLECFARLRKNCYQEDDDRSTSLYTYSVATPIRMAMMLAGFYVGYGQATGLKTETTQFSSHLSAIYKPLAREWYGRWVRSHSKFPHGTSARAQEEYTSRLENHPQISPYKSEARELLKAAFPGRKWDH